MDAFLSIMVFLRCQTHVGNTPLPLTYYKCTALKEPTSLRVRSIRFCSLTNTTFGSCRSALSLSKAGLIYFFAVGVSTGFPCLDCLRKTKRPYPAVPCRWNAAPSRRRSLLQSFPADSASRPQVDIAGEGRGKQLVH